jgi:hypothetical protein
MREEFVLRFDRYVFNSPEDKTVVFWNAICLYCMCALLVLE